MPYYQTVISCLKSFFSFYQFFFEKVVDIAETMSYKPLRRHGNGASLKTPTEWLL